MPANDNATINSDRYPLKDVVICSTSVPSDVRTRLADAAQEMGASHQLDLTANVTHLVVGSVSTEKYRYVARERPDVCVLHPDWVKAVKEAWRSDETIDLPKLEEKYRFPTFAGLRICITGITDTEERNRIASIVQENGAEYHGDLTKQVTHLVVARPEGAKYTAMRSWGLPTVSVKWLEDSVTRQMSLEPKYYDPTVPLDEQGKGAFRKQMKPSTSLGKRLREEETRTSLDGDPGKRKLRRTASRRLEGNSQGMWQDISAGDFKSELKEADQWTSVGQTSELGSRHETPRGDSERPTTANQPQEAPSKPQGLFSGWHIFVKGFDRSKAERLATFLNSNGAQVVSREGDLEGASDDTFFKGCCICVPHAQPVNSLGLDKAPAGTATATEWWVERCIHYKRFIEPEDDILSQPLGDVSAMNLSHMTIAISGFTGVDYRQAAEAIKLTGATLVETRLVPGVSVLINGPASIRKEKALYAAKNGFPVVSAGWLWETLRTRTQADINRFKIELPTGEYSDSFGEPSTSSPGHSDMMRASHGNARKDTQPLARLSNTRKRHATPTLALKAFRPAQMPAPRPSGPFVHEDDDNDDDTATTALDDSTHQPVMSPHTSRPQPLADISPNASPHKTRPNIDDSFSKPVRPPSPPLVDEDSHPPAAEATNPTPSIQPIEPTPPPPPDYTASLASLMSHRRGTSRPGTSNTSTPEQPQPRQKPRKLGRAASNSNLTNRSHSAATDKDLYDLAEGDDASSAPDVQQPPPSTQLGYETPEAEAARLVMAKRFGTALEEEGGGTRLKSLGTVKDSAASGTGGGGGGSRGKGARRTGGGK